MEAKSRWVAQDTIGLFFLVLIFAVAAMGAPGTHDVPIALRWIDDANAFGLRQGYIVNHGDYPPLGSAIMLAAYRFFHLFGANQFWSFKLSLLLFLVADAGFLYIWFRNSVAAILLMAAFIIVGPELAYLDVYFALPLMGALWALQERRIALASFLATVAIAIKWQPLIIAPFFLVYLLKGKDGRLSISLLLRAFIPFALTSIALMLFYGWDPIERAFDAAISHASLSGNALNYNWLLLYYLETMRPEIAGGLFHHGVISSGTNDPQYAYLYFFRYLFNISYAATLIAYVMRRTDFRDLLLYSGLGYITYFLFNTGVHENHLFLVVLFYAVLALKDPSRNVLAAAMGVLFNLNLLLFYGLSGQPALPRDAIGIDITVPAALIVSLFLTIVWLREIFAAPLKPKEAFAALPRWLGLEAMKARQD